VIACGLDTMFYLYTGRVGIRPFLSRPTSLFYGDEYPATGTLKDFVSILIRYRPTYIVQPPMPGFAEEEPFKSLLSNFMHGCFECFELVYADAHSNVYMINHDRVLLTLGSE
jgi:hypothetical protein